MKNNVIVLMVLLAGFQLLIGCQRILLFQPPPPMFMSWTKQGATEGDVKRTMLECGYPSVAGVERETKPNDEARMDVCMRRAGYYYRSGFDLCKLSSYKAQPACIELNGE